MCRLLQLKKQQSFVNDKLINSFNGSSFIFQRRLIEYPHLRNVALQLCVVSLEATRGQCFTAF